MAENLIDILIQSREAALGDLRAVRIELAGLRQELGPLSGTAAAAQSSFQGLDGELRGISQAAGQLELGEQFEQGAASAGALQAEAAQLKGELLGTAQAGEQTAQAAQHEATGHDRAAGSTRVHRAAASDLTGTLRLTRQQLDALGQGLSAIVPQANAVILPLQNASRALAAIPVAGQVVGGVALALGALGSLATAGAKGLADQVEQLQNLSRATGAAIPELQVLHQVFKDQGLGVESADFALQNLNRAFGNANPLLKQLGITTRDPVEALLQLSRLFAQSGDEAGKTRIAFELLGRGSRDVLAVIDQLAAVFPGLRQEMAATGQLLGEDMVRQGEKFDAAWDKFSHRFEGFMTSMRGAAAVFANDVIDLFGGLAEIGQPVQDEASQIEKQISRLQSRVSEWRRFLADTSHPAALVGVDRKRIDEEISGFEAQISRLELQLGRLRGLRAGFGEDELPGGPSAERRPFELPQPQDDALRKSIEEIGRLLRVDAQEAERLARAIKAFQDEGERKDLLDLLQKIGEEGHTVADSLGRALAPILDQGPKAGATLSELRAAFAALDELEPIELPEVRVSESARRAIQDMKDLREQDLVPAPEERPTLSPGIALSTKEMQSFTEELEEMADLGLASINILRIGFEGFAQGLGAIFSGLVSGANNLGQALTSIFRSMVSAILNELGRLLAAKIFLFFLKLIGGPAGAIAGSVGEGAVSGYATGPGISPPPPALNSALRPPSEIGLSASASLDAAATRLARSIESLERSSLGAAPAGRAMGGLNQEFKFSVEALDAGSFIDYMAGPLGAGRLAGLKRAVATPY